MFFKKLKKKENKVRASYGENRGKRGKTGENRDWQTCGRRLPAYEEKKERGKTVDRCP
jgi:hypothetical protein